jgi:hypothetical protein
MNLFLILFTILNGIINVVEHHTIPVQTENSVMYFYTGLMSKSVVLNRNFRNVFSSLEKHYGKRPFVPIHTYNYKLKTTEMLSTTIAWNDDVSLFQRFLKTSYAVPYFQGNIYFSGDFDYTRVLHRNLKNFLDVAIEMKSHHLLQHLVENLVDVVPSQFYLPLSYQILEYLEIHSSWYRSYRKEKDYETSSSNKFLNHEKLTTKDILRGVFHPESKLPLNLHQLTELVKTNETVLEQVATEPWILEYLRN